MSVIDCLCSLPAHGETSCDGSGDQDSTNHLFSPPVLVCVLVSHLMHLHKRNRRAKDKKKKKTRYNSLYSNDLDPLGNSHSVDAVSEALHV